MRNISITTHLKGKNPNSYTLEVDGENYLYFSELDLLLGFIARVGSCNDENADRSTLMNSLFNIMLGEKYANDVDKLNMTVQRLTEKYNDKIKRLNNEIQRFQKAADDFASFNKKLDETQEKIKAMEQSLKEARGPFLEYKHQLVQMQSALTELDKHFKSTSENVSNSKADKKGKKTKDDKEPKGKGRGGRAKADEAILKEIEKQAMDNPNIK